MKVQMSAIEKNQTMDIDMRSGQIQMLIDRDALEQVLLNIITNAIRYTDEGGKILLTTKMEQYNIIIRVSDNGFGIPSEDLKRIFERFYRVDKARVRELGGTGLGLPIAQHIVEANGGEIRIESEPNVGTIVTIILPIENYDSFNQN